MIVGDGANGMRMKLSTSYAEFFAEYCSYTSSDFLGLLCLEDRAINLGASPLHG